MLALLVALLAAAATPDPPHALRVGLDPSGAPWAFVLARDYSKEDFRQQPRLTRDEIARLAGLDVDVIRALERRMGVELQIVPTRWEEIEKNLLAGQYDLILNAWTPSAKTPAAIAASDPYYEWGLTVAVRSDDARLGSLSDLAERHIGHIDDPSVIRALRAMGAGLGARLTAVSRGGEELFERLGRRQFDAIVFDSAYVRWRVARERSFRVLGEPLNRLGYHVGVRAADKALLKSVQAAVKAFVGSEEAAAIRRKWESAATLAP